MCECDFLVCIIGRRATLVFYQLQGRSQERSERLRRISESALALMQASAVRLAAPELQPTASTPDRVLGWRSQWTGEAA